MDAIIVGANGRPSILELIRTFPFKSNVAVFNYRRGKGGKTTWYKYLSSDKGNKRTVVNEPSFKAGDKVIMWGTRVQVQLGNAIVYNHPSVTRNASNKKAAREIFVKEKIDAPKLVKNNELHTTQYPVIIRKDHHRAGIGFHIANSDEEALNFIKNMKGQEYYISEIYPKTEEYRVHCAHGKALLVKRKPEPEDKSIVAWNFHQIELPWTTIERKNYDFDMVTLALNACKAIGVDFGAVDIMSNPVKGYKGPKHVVVEINTAPSYTPYLISKYGAYFDLLFNSATKVEHWDYTKFNKGNSLSWKNKQLNS